MIEVLLVEIHLPSPTWIQQCYETLDVINTDYTDKLQWGLQWSGILHCIDHSEVSNSVVLDLCMYISI